MDNFSKRANKGQFSQRENNGGQKKKKKFLRIVRVCKVRYRLVYAIFKEGKK
jgi:hypothetical protein